MHAYVCYENIIFNIPYLIRALIYNLMNYYNIYLLLYYNLILIPPSLQLYRGLKMV